MPLPTTDECLEADERIRLTQPDDTPLVELGRSRTSPSCGNFAQSAAPLASPTTLGIVASACAFEPGEGDPVFVASAGAPQPGDGRRPSSRSRDRSRMTPKPIGPQPGEPRWWRNHHAQVVQVFKYFTDNEFKPLRSFIEVKTENLRRKYKVRERMPSYFSNPSEDRKPALRYLTLDWPLLQGGHGEESKQMWMQAMRLCQMEKGLGHDLIHLRNSGLAGRAQANEILWDILYHNMQTSSDRHDTNQKLSKILHATKHLMHIEPIRPDIHSWIVHFKDQPRNQMFSPLAVPREFVIDVWVSDTGEPLRPPACWSPHQIPPGYDRNVLPVMSIKPRQSSMDDDEAANREYLRAQVPSSSSSMVVKQD